MKNPPRGSIAVIFRSRLSGADAEGYAEAAARMDALAAEQSGYLGMESVHDAAGEGITVSWWADEAAARAWRDHPEHEATREAGRARWYDWYELAVTETVRAYSWKR